MVYNSHDHKRPLVWSSGGSSHPRHRTLARSGAQEHPASKLQADSSALVTTAMLALDAWKVVSDASNALESP